MKAVFADTFFFLAAVNPDDAAHDRAMQFSDNYDGPLLTTAWVIIELADALASREQRHAFRELHESLATDARVEILPADQPLFERGLKLYFDRPDKDWSLTDCISFVVMKERKIADAATGDHHFDQAGFHALLR